MGGYSETQLDTNIFRVSVRGNGFTSHERAADLALLRGAELTLKHGYSHFVVIDERSYTKSAAVTTPTQSFTTGTVTAYGNGATMNATTTTYGGQTFVVSKPRTSNTIALFNTKPPASLNAYDAEFLCRSLGDKFGVSCEKRSLPANDASNSSYSPKPARANVKFESPEGWVVKEMTARQIETGGQLYAVNYTLDSAFFVSTVQKSYVDDFHSYAISRRAVLASRLSDPIWSDVSEITINGRRAWRFSVKGKAGSLNAKYLGTILEGHDSVVFVNAWTSELNYEMQREHLESLAQRISGF